MSQHKSKVRRPAKTNAAGRQLMGALAEIKAAEKTGDFSRMIVRRVEIPDPGTYRASSIKSLREKLRLTQRVFALLIGVSVELVEHWEQGRRAPGLLARRLLDEIARDPDRWRGMVRRSA